MLKQIIMKEKKTSNFIKNKTLWFYLIKFIGVFCVCYFGTLAVIGLATPGRLYSSFIAEYLDYVNWLRTSLLYGTKWLTGIFHYDTYFAGPYVISVKGGSGIRMVYSCLGIGVMSFWIAFVAANKGSFWKKIKWITGGWVVIWIINVIRLSLVLAATNGRWKIPLFDHHTWFNIVAYLMIFILIWLYDRSFKNKMLKKIEN